MEGKGTGGVGVALGEHELRQLGGWAAACAERALPLFEERAPADRRPRDALECIRDFATGERRSKRLRVAALAALAAARAAGDPVATSAARAAGYAASSAYLHPLATLGQAKHILCPAVYAARALELEAGDDPAVGEAEVRGAVARCPAAVRALLRRMPARANGRSRLAALLYLLDAGLRG